jgi:N-methylhydantoinase A
VGTAEHAGDLVGVDVGGTFTDFAHWDGTVLTTTKRSTTPDQSEAVVEGAVELSGEVASRLVHGTTVATNALLERKGADTGLVTSAGFGDVLEIGRQDRPSLYDPFAARAEPLVPKVRRIELETGRLPDDAAARLAGVEALAVSLLHGYREPDAERRVAEELAELVPGVPISLSSDVAAEVREYERGSTTVLNAYLAPGMDRYLGALTARASASLGRADISVMRSSGGLMSLEMARRLPVAALLSGPAGGVVAAAALGDRLDRDRIISFDMGGTSTDVCRIEGGRPEVQYGRSIAGFPCLSASVAIHTVGAGGGSIAWVDPGGSLRVGPQSAGAQPGPAAYGRGGTEPTVSDANVVLGRIDPAARLAGRLEVRADLARRAVEGVGTHLGLGLDATARGIVTVVEEVMASALRRVSVEEGVDPRGAWLVAFGGAGGLHAVSLARSLDMAGVVIPRHAGVFSALGLLLSPPRVDVARSVMLLDRDDEALATALAAVRREAANQLVAAIGAGSSSAVQCHVDVRYRHQSHELAVPIGENERWTDVAARFHEFHRVRNGFARPEDPVEIVTVRAEAVGEPALDLSQLPEVDATGEALRTTRPVATVRGAEEVPVYRRSGLRVGDGVSGPAVIEENDATTFLDHGDAAVVVDGGSLEVSW